MFAKLTLSASVLFGAAVLSLPAQNSNNKYMGSGSSQNQSQPRGSGGGGGSFFQAGGGSKQSGQGSGMGKQTGQGTGSGKQTGSGQGTGKAPPPPPPMKVNMPPMGTNPKSTGTTNPNPMKVITNPGTGTSTLPKTTTFPKTTTLPKTTTDKITLPAVDKLKITGGDKLKLPMGTGNPGNKAPLVLNPGNKGPFIPGKSGFNPNVRLHAPKLTPKVNVAELNLHSDWLKKHLSTGGQLQTKNSRVTLPSQLDSKISNKQNKVPTNQMRTFAKQTAGNVETKYNGQLTPPQKTALNNFYTNGTWSPQDRAVVSNLIYTNNIGMTNQETASLSKALMMDRMLLNDDDVAPVAAGQISTSPSQIRVVNRTGEKLKFWIQYRNAADSESSPEWNPMAANELSALEYSLAPGEDEEGKAFDLRVGGKNLLAYSIHYWAMTPSEQWADFMEQELVLTPDESNIYELAFAR